MAAKFLALEPLVLEDLVAFTAAMIWLLFPAAFIIYTHCLCLSCSPSNEQNSPKSKIGRFTS